MKNLSRKALEGLPRMLNYRHDCQPRLCDQGRKQLKPTDLAEVVTDLLVKHFPDIVDYKFTAEMEESLDLIAEGKKNGFL